MIFYIWAANFSSSFLCGKRGAREREILRRGDWRKIEEKERGKFWDFG